MFFIVLEEEVEVVGEASRNPDLSFSGGSSFWKLCRLDVVIQHKLPVGLGKQMSKPANRLHDIDVKY